MAETFIVTHNLRQNIWAHPKPYYVGSRPLILINSKRIYMLFDFGFNLNPDIKEVKNKNISIRLSKCEKRIKAISDKKIYTKEILLLLKEEIELLKSLKASQEGN